MNPDWRTHTTLTVEQAAGILGIGRSAAYQATGSGDLPVLRVGRRVLVPVGALRRLLGEIDPIDSNAPAEQTEASPKPRGQIPRDPDYT